MSVTSSRSSPDDILHPTESKLPRTPMMDRSEHLKALARHRERTRAELQAQDEANQRFWGRVELTATLLESTAGKDKVLKLSQYSLRVILSFFDQLRSVWGEEIAVFGRILRIQPRTLLRHFQILSKQISTSRKLFRLGRTIHAWYMVRQLLDEPNVFLQIVGLCSWFWNGVYFICDHSAYLKGIGILKSDPLLRLNRVSVVAMQTFLFLFNCRKLALSLAQEREIQAELEVGRQQELRGGSRRSSSLEFSGNHPSAAAAAAATPDFHPSTYQRPLPDLTSHIKSALVGVCSVKPEELEDQPEEILLELLAATRQGRLHAIYPDFIKNIGDGCVCYDFGFDLGLPPLLTNLLGLVASLAGMYLEIFKARKRKNVLLRTLKPATPPNVQRAMLFEEHTKSPSPRTAKQ